MAWQKFGYENSLEYDPDRDVLRFGTYEFNSKDAKMPVVARYQAQSADVAMKTWEESYLAKLQEDSKKQSGIAGILYGGETLDPIQRSLKLDAERPVIIGQKDLSNGMFEYVLADRSVNQYDFVNNISSMANALSASIAGGDGSEQRPRRRTATGAF